MAAVEARSALGDAFISPTQNLQADTGQKQPSPTDQIYNNHGKQQSADRLDDPIDDRRQKVAQSSTVPR
ncbi:hypothetical protein N7534_007925 [Penicillium rubens]|uniref:Uncharacterized protein n=1 Tax=Penicillium chrysogenum TaxID=5076 RepID=A0ABQ8WDN4_PENCH|nr:hypothetical protein N7505_007544 [Penicillium chrysogenum]KAJ5849236.1 hypothetical protein N7534_007925 [Penicillium rubens]